MATVVGSAVPIDVTGREPIRRHGCDRRRRAPADRDRANAWHGEVWFEVELLVGFGFSPMQAILAATCNAADLLGELDDIGMVEEGELADLIAVGGDPLKSIAAVKDVYFVPRDGIHLCSPISRWSASRPRTGRLST